MNWRLAVPLPAPVMVMLVFRPVLEKTTESLSAETAVPEKLVQFHRRRIPGCRASAAGKAGPVDGCGRKWREDGVRLHVSDSNVCVRACCPDHER